MLAKTITAEDGRMVSCVDYILGNLLNDPVEKLQGIIDKILMPRSKEHKEMTECLTIARHFLKVHFDNHLSKGDGDGFHDLSHALAKQLPSAKCATGIHTACTVCTSSSSGPHVNCHACKFPFWVCSKLDSFLDQAKIECNEQFASLPTSTTIPNEETKSEQFHRHHRTTTTKSIQSLYEPFRFICGPIRNKLPYWKPVEEAFDRLHPHHACRLPTTTTTNSSNSNDNSSIKSSSLFQAIGADGPCLCGCRAFVDDGPLCHS
jgi:hypothetical protein